jgi:hypothetical protein
MRLMANDPRDEELDVEIICPECGCHLVRSADRLRRNIPVVSPNCGNAREATTGSSSADDARRRP